MPIYEYRCRRCDHIFEKIQKWNEGPETTFCPQCGEGNPEKLISSFSSSKGGESSSCGSSGTTRFS